MLWLLSLVAPSGERLLGEGKCGVFAVWKLCDSHLSASAVSFLLWGAIQISVCLYLFYLLPHTVDLTVFTLQSHHTCLYLVSVHQTAPLLTSDSSHLIWLQLLLYLIIDPKRMKGWVGLVAVLVAFGSFCFIKFISFISYKWLPISCRSVAGQGKFAGQRRRYHWATPLI